MFLGYSVATGLGLFPFSHVQKGHLLVNFLCEGWWQLVPGVETVRILSRRVFGTRE
jgi:hypothetical protein